MSHAMIAISEDGLGFLIKWIKPEEWVIRAHDEYDILPEITFKEKPGLYRANMTSSYCRGSYCACEARDCWEHDWEIEELIFPF